MSHRTTVTARWPFTPLGTRVEVEVPESYDCDGIASSLAEAQAELWKNAPTARLAIAISKLFRR